MSEANSGHSQGEIEGLQSKITDNERKINTFESEIEKLQAEITDNRMKINTFESEIEKLQTQVNEIEYKIDQLSMNDPSGSNAPIKESLLRKLDEKRNDISFKRSLLLSKSEIMKVNSEIINTTKNDILAIRISNNLLLEQIRYLQDYDSPEQRGLVTQEQVKLSFPAPCFRQHPASDLRKSYGGLYSCCALPWSPRLGLDNERLRRLYDVPSTLRTEDLPAGYEASAAYGVMSQKLWNLKFCAAVTYRETEKSYVQGNLEIIMELISRFSKQFMYSNDFNLICTSSVKSINLAKLLLCKDSTEPDGALYYSLHEIDNVMVIVGEAKSFESSSHDCLAQLISVGSGACLHLRELGVTEEQCIVPSLAVTGNSFQVFATLLFQGIPQFVQVSDSVQLIQRFSTRNEANEDGFCNLQHWIVHLSRFAVETANLITQVKDQKSSSPPDGSLRDYFLKPVERAYHRKDMDKSLSSFQQRSGGSKSSKSNSAPSSVDTSRKSDNSRTLAKAKEAQSTAASSVETRKTSRQWLLLNHLFDIYHRIHYHQYEDSEEHNVCSSILFPVGVLSIPYRWEAMFDQNLDSGTEWNAYRSTLVSSMHENFRNEAAEWALDGLILVAFPLLKDGWSNSIPADDDTKGFYLQQLLSIVEFLNECNIVHGDLRPPNIFWRMKDKLEMKIIDFEMSYVIGDYVDNSLITYLDERFPWNRENRRLLLHFEPNDPVDYIVADRLDNFWFIIALKLYFENSNGKYDDYVRENHNLIAALTGKN